MAFAEKEKAPRCDSTSEVLKHIKKKFSKTNPEIIFDPNRKYDVMSSGNLKYDIISGVGGFPKRRLSEVIAMEGMGKTSLVLSAMGTAQARKKKCILFDFEQSFNEGYARKTFDITVDDKTIIVVSPICIEDGDYIFERFMESQEDFDLIAFDSIECMKPRAFIEGSMDDSQMIGAHAKAISWFVHKVRNAAFLKGFAGIFTNQLKHQINKAFQQGIGISTGNVYQDPYITPGGMTPRFLCSIRTKLLPGGKIEEAYTDGFGKSVKQETGKTIKFVNVKNKCATPHLVDTSRFDYPMGDYKGGWNLGIDVLDIMKKIGRIKKDGQTYSYTGLKTPELSCRGQDAFERKFCESSEIIKDALTVYEKFRAEQNNADRLVGRATLGVELTEDELNSQEDHEDIENPPPAITLDKN